MNSRSPLFVFYILIIAQFCVTSLWFVGNAALPELQNKYSWDTSFLGYITSATQIGFIAGTLCLAILRLADRISPSKLFLLCSFLASACNAFSLFDLSSFTVVLTSRILTGFFLAGIYPVGMKIAADWNENGLGRWLGALVGALVVGTALPHGLKNVLGIIQSKTLLIFVSGLALFGGVLIGYLISDGPFRKKGTRFSFKGLGSVFRNRYFRIASFGYFGHMWELYAFWAFVPWIVKTYELKSGMVLPGFMPFIIIASGALGCLLGGWWSREVGSFRVAYYALIFSGLCCLISPMMFNMTPILFAAFMIFWGFTVVADSPQFSALVAKNSPPELKGSSITLVTCIGFSITVLSIQIMNTFQDVFHSRYLCLLLFPGPFLGVFALTLHREKR